MAGGKGTRLHSFTEDRIPKPMASVAGRPILEWQIECLKRNGINDICIVTGHLGEVIHSHFKDGSKFDVSIFYFNEDSPMGTAGALPHIGGFLTEPYFLLLNGDTIFDIDISRMELHHKEKKAFVTLFVHPNSHPYDSDLVVLNSYGRIIGFDSKSNTRDYWYDNMVNAGAYILSSDICALIPLVGKTDLERDILFKYHQTHRMYGYFSTEYIKDVGTLDRIKQAETDISNGIVAAKNLSNKQCCIFLDRDGTINVYKGLVYNPDDFELINSAAEAIALINRSIYVAAVASNQPVVARGLCEIEDVEIIHRKMKTMLGREGAYLDWVDFCPHHPDKGYPEENPLYKISCDCRKPGTGMFIKAAQAMNIDISKSWMVGDSARDMEAARNTGLRSVLVRTGEDENSMRHHIRPDMVCGDILEAVKAILSEPT